MWPAICTTVVITVVGIKTGDGVCGVNEMLTCSLGSLLPELAVVCCYLCPFVEESRQLI